MLERVGTYLFAIFCFWLAFRLIDWLISRIPDKPSAPRLPLTRSQKKKISYSYKGNGTVLDNLIYELVYYLDDAIKSIQVHGINEKPKKQEHEAFGRMECEPEIDRPLKRYWIRILAKPRAWRFTTPNTYRYKLGKYKRDLTPKDYANFYREDNLRNREKAASILKSIFKDFNGRFGVAVSFGKSAYISIGAELAISSLELMLHGSASKVLTSVGHANAKKIARLMDEILIDRSISADDLYDPKNEILRYEIVRESENKFREAEGLPLVGEGYIEETRLYYLVRDEFPDAIREYSPKWLGRQRIDIYIPSKNIGIEYNGEQHYRPVDWFGGNEGFLNQQKRDERKRDLCETNGLPLIEWRFNEEVLKENLHIKLITLIPDEPEHPF
tara:strand:+ start:114 stop:1271 length:1158 start_codon:yes stop_codon:yes gene_type:complete